MNKHISHLSVVLAGVFSACSGAFTDLNPVSQRNANGFYRNADDFVSAINATYKVLQASGTYNNSYWALHEMRSDNTDQGSDGTGLGASLTQIENFTEIATNDLVTAAYTDSYLGVARANIVLSRIDAVEFDGQLKNRIKGEALFLRSLFYYNLAITFGNIPLVLQEPQSVEESLGQPQVPASAVYAQLATDLQQAESGLPVSYTGNNVGRATKGAAAILLAKVYLLQGDRPAAVPVLRRIISDYGYTLLDDYSGLWGLENENNAESIFEVQFQGGGTGTGNSFTTAFSPWLPRTTGTFRNRPTNELLSAYLAGDKRFSASLDTIYTNSSGSTLTNSRNDARFIVKYGKTNAHGENDGSNNFIVFRYADVLLSLAEALGESEEAYALINQVRKRGSNTAIPQVGPGTPGSFADKLLYERRVEFAFENHRWPDLLRFGKAETVLRAIGKSPRLLYLIPQRELDINRHFKQNE